MKKLLFLSLTMLLANGLLFGQLLPQSPAAPPAAVDNDEVYKVVETRPLFSSITCDSLDRKTTERIDCAAKALHDYLYEHLNYPEIARKNGVEGTVYANFIIEKDGSITNIKIVRDIGAGCGDAVLELLSKMPKWVPAMQRNKVVRIQQMLPVKFMLKGDKPVKPPFKP